MTDYAKWKVTDLKAELKRRGIPQTGLRVKQQFIDRLVEEDAQEGKEAVANGEPPTEQDATPDTKQPVESEPPAPEPVAPEPEAVPIADAPDKPEPEVKEKEVEEPVQEEMHDQEQSDAVKETKPEPVADEVSNEKVAEQEQQDHLEESAQESPKQEETNEPTDTTMTDQPTDTTVVEPADTSIAQYQTETTAAPVEQAPGEAALEQSTTAEQKDAEPRATDETAPPVAVPSENTTALSTPLPTEEVLEDRRKRKRRSQSPVPTLEALASKKAKAQDETPRVLLPEDQDAMDQEREARQDGGDDAGPPGTPEERAGPDTAPEHDAPPVQDETSKKGAPLKHDVRFKGLFAAKETEQTRPVSPPPDAVMEDADVEPALHVATAALYVGGLMRPLQPVALRNHLVSLASPPDASPNPDVIVDFYLDPIKTHCFVSFTSVSAASRVRTSLHATVWPNERNRKTLFVDFVPEDKLPQWIEKEEGSRQRGGPPPRWEVRYDPTEDGVEAVLEEIDPRNAASQPARGPEPSGFSRPPPTGPRAELGAPGRRPSDEVPAESSSRPGQGFKPLDELFMSTTTKPKLYYLPVPREVADRRLDRFDDLLRKGEFPRRGGDEPRRMTFEDDDFFVDNGPDFGGGNGRNRRGRGRGGRGRGGFGDSWRDDRRTRY
ncbi:hypothetical protein BO94DRAFT_467613 [Aspergillus sclerotioniger CBS 115572]|uniref:SAP domain-containing protein n=1 Tax=Aspergillus sclerotioniger CBS 115572 TaxID=1450535 RepID=A0A317WL50_9EURO|nr:hypothetical protein BO94DRAFT_467613 [Aspergillus sclerotioniger CBS 115572]PWY85787.1 hypothetical protein BO94DRAFT_467613 [Aspergillus sclerotioniger CBS 115572]